MKTKTIYLRTCPFCGRKPEIMHDDGTWERYFYVICGNARCKVHPRTMSHLKIETAVRAWNGRAPA